MTIVHSSSLYRSLYRPLVYSIEKRECIGRRKIRERGGGDCYNIFVVLGAIFQLAPPPLEFHHSYTSQDGKLGVPDAPGLFLQYTPQWCT